MTAMRWFAALVACSWFIPLPAASAATVAAASCAREAVQFAVDAAGSGDTVTVPGGTCVWGSALVLPSTKDLGIIGAGIDHTVLTCASGVCFQIHLAVAHRVSGFTMSGPGGMIATTNNNNQDRQKYFRIDHNRLVSTSGWEEIAIAGSTNGVHPQGVVDNNQIVDISIKTIGSNHGLDEGNYQNMLWAQPTPLGDGTQTVYIESNVFAGSAANINFADGNYGSRYVFRFNRASGRGYIEIHSVQGRNRAAQRFELYRNVFTTEPGGLGLAFIRGGSGVVFGNRLPGSYTTDIVLDNVRSERHPGDSAGQCDGSSGWDGNAPGQRGYPCRDQIGRAYDAVLWNDSPPGPYTQVFQPVYLWGNSRGGAPFVVDTSSLDTWIRQNRDWYTTAVPFDGTAGVGEGPLGNRPATCTPGVAYWATDEGDWDTTAPPGTSGRLYRCTATNVWSLYYTPFTYPHPGTADSGPAPVPTLFTLSIDRTGSGAGRVTSAPGGIDCGTACSANFPAGTAVTLTATPDSGSSFDGWSACGGTGSCDIVLTGSTTLTATFAGTTAPPPTLSMSANPLSVQPGETSTLTWSSTNATGCTAANAGADGSTWRGPKATNGIDVRGPLEATATYTLTCEGPGGTVSRSVIIEVVAAPPTWSLTARVTGPGTIAVSGCDILNCLWCTVALPAGTTVILTPRPHPGARFIGWVGTDGCSTAGPCTLTMTSARTVTARFAMP